MHQPLIMVAPNGARRSRADHPKLPLTIPEIVTCACGARAAGAQAIHAHVRDEAGRHVLDAGLYRELLDELQKAEPDLVVQVTSEAGGRYGPAEQRALIEGFTPPGLTAALFEITGDNDEVAARNFYWSAAEAGIAIQHIIYSPEEVEKLANLQARGTVPLGPLSVLFVLGSYAGQLGSPSDLDAFLAARAAYNGPLRFMVCAFGRQEIACAVRAARAGGDCRVGFENNIYRPDGGLLRDNSESVERLVGELRHSSGTAAN